MDTLIENVHGLKTFDAGEEQEVRLKAYQLCREYLNGAWRQIAAEDFVIKKVGGGLSNLLYFCALPSGVNPLRDEPSRVLLRIYGPTHDGENVLEAHFSECVVFTMLSEKENGPRLYGIFPGGRLEQYIPGRPLTTDELMDEELSLMLAEAFARIHKMSVPLSKEPKYLWNTLFRWVGQIEKYLQCAEVSDHNKAIVATLRCLDLRAEVTWLKNYLKALRSPVVFCHNDLQEGNILLTQSESGEKSINLIDFEYCAYNYRGYDLANHFCETMYDYSNEEFPFFWAKPENYPSRDKQEKFVERYLCSFHNTDSVSAEEIDQVLDEIKAFTLAVHLFWAVWSVVTGASSSITFDYRGFGEARLSTYFEHKGKLLNTEDVHTTDGCVAVDQASKNIDNTLSTSLIETS